jgi:hypothetical protein
MSDFTPNPAPSTAIDDAMVEAMTKRRVERMERRQGVRTPKVERRRLCGYCFQPGDHSTPAACLRALER